MKQLGALDSAFINLEQPNTPQHIGGMGIYDPATAADGFVRFKDVMASFERRLSRLPLFRTRLVEVAGDVDRPYWVMDEKFDLEFHLRHIGLPEPGDWRQLCIQVARLHARPLDMSRPLWEAYIIEGLDNIPGLPAGSFAIYTKIHRSIVDGVGGQAFIMATHDLTPDPVEAELPEEAVLVDRQPAQLDLLGRGLINQLKNAVRMSRDSLGVTRDLASYGLQIARGEISAPDIRAPKTRLNQPVGPHRVFEACTLPLAEVTRIKNALEVTVNDLALGIIAGALRRYLQHYEALPEAPIAVSIPVNMRSRGRQEDTNNQLGTVFAEIHTDEANPIERLKKIKASTHQAKTAGEASPLVDTLKLAGVFPPWLSKGAAQVYARANLSRLLPGTTTTVVSNVAGPAFDLYCAGARLVRYHGLGVLTPGVGMFHLVFSSGGVLTLSVLADRKIVPDPEFYRSCLEQSYAEFRELAIETGQKPARGKRQPTGKVSASAPARRAKPRTATKKLAKKPAATPIAAKSTARKRKITRSKAR